nr:MAG TPA: hypothetical protein [Bacteriophage sp.]
MFFCSFVCHNKPPYFHFFARQKAARYGLPSA